MKYFCLIFLALLHGFNSWPFIIKPFAQISGHQDASSFGGLSCQDGSSLGRGILSVCCLLENLWPHIFSNLIFVAFKLFAQIPAIKMSHLLVAFPAKMAHLWVGES